MDKTSYTVSDEGEEPRKDQTSAPGRKRPRKLPSRIVHPSVVSDCKPDVQPTCPS